MEIQSIKNRFGIIGNSPGLNFALQVAAQVAATDLTVLISGESGVGKEAFSMALAKSEVVIYHNPACTTSRKVLGMIRDAGVQPRVVEYLKTPPNRTELLAFCAAWT